MSYASRACFGLCLLLLTGIFSAQADIKNPSNTERSPVPQPVKVTVNRGETVTITLNALTASSKDVVFLLRSNPLAGKILDPEPVRKSKTSATFRYQSDPEGKVSQEVVKFAARIADGTVSPNESVTIQILEIMPQLELPARVDAGQVRFGQLGEATFTARNSGNGDFDQIVKLPEGWNWIHGERLQVPAGKSVELSLHFSPRALGSSVSPLKIGDSPKAQTTLVGFGLLPVDFPESVALAWDPATARRRADVTMRNPTNEKMSATLSGPNSKLHFPEEISLPPRAEVPLAIELDDLPSTPLNARLTLHVGGVSVPVLVTASPAPAQVELTGLSNENVVDFGAVEAGEISKAEKSLVLTNKGGTPVTLFGNLPESFEIAGFQPGMTLAPASAIPLTIRIKPGSAGRLNDTVKLSWDKTPLHFQIHAEILQPLPQSNGAQPSSPTTQIIPDDPSAPYEPLETSDSKTLDSEMRIVRDGLLPSFMKFNPDHPRVTDIHMIGDTSNSITLAWKLAPGSEYTYEVLHRKLGQSGGFPIVVWMPVTNVTYGKNSLEATATIRGLRAEDGANGYRIVTKGPDGTYSLPTDPLPFGIPMHEEIDWMKWLLIASPIILWGLWKWWKSREIVLPRSYRSRIEGEQVLGERLFEAEK